MNLCTGGWPTGESSGIWSNATPSTATASMVAKIRKQTNTLMTVAASTNCPSIGNPELAKALSTAR